MTRPPLGRLLALLAALLLAFGAVVVRLGVLQVQESGDYARKGFDQRIRTVALPADRGEILDRTETPLAISLDAADVYANPTSVTDPVGEAAAMAPVLQMRQRDIETLLRSDGTFVYVARQLDLKAVDRIRALELPGIGFLPASRRFYPAGSLASQVLGFVGIDGSGLSGLESEYDTLLQGTPGERTAEVSAGGQPIAGGFDDERGPVRGADVVTTIDREIQFRAQAALARAVKDNHAKGGTIIVMDPVTGDIYAMASYPWFDPNRFGSFAPDRWRNRAVTDTWEPGSVNKIITAAAAIETGAVGLDQRLTVPSFRRVGGFTIHDSEPHPVERMTLGDIIARSSNIGASLVADRIGSDRLASYFAQFGYGHPTGVGFPGEAAGLVPRLVDWTDLTRATLSFGQGVAVSPLQMASVYATIANDGTWVQPRLVLGTRDAQGILNPAPASETHPVLEPSTADLLTRMLAYVVQDGTGYNAQIPGYQVAGKTGTAKKLDHFGHYTDRYVASFIGFLPASHPRIVVAAIIDEPSTIYGGVAAAPLFQQVARASIQRLGIEAAPPVALPPHAQRAP